MDNETLGALPSFSRRELAGAIGIAAVAAGSAGAVATAIVQETARDEAFWRRIASHYRMPMGTTNLENGMWGVMAQPVLEAYKTHIDRVNSEGVTYIRGSYPKHLETARGRVAAALGADILELAFTRGATEAMQALIGGYNRLRAGVDAVLYSDLDYPGMQYAMKWLAVRRGARVARFTIPEPATTKQSLVDAYAQALDANKDVRMMLVTHCSHKTGLLFPVAEIVAMARARNVDVIVDAAHSWGQVELSVDGLGADFVGFTLQKWIAGPVGLGAVYIRKKRLAAIDPMMGDEDNPADSVLSRVHSGTSNFAAALTAPAALDFHESVVGAANKAARLRYLRDRWVSAVRGVAGVQILTPDGIGLAAGITSFRIKGRTSTADNQQLVETLRNRYGLFTARRTGLSSGDCVRITPAIYNSVDDVDRLASAMRELAAAAV